MRWSPISRTRRPRPRDPAGGLAEPPRTPRQVGLFTVIATVTAPLEVTRQTSRWRPSCRWTSAAQRGSASSAGRRDHEPVSVCPSRSRLARTAASGCDQGYRQSARVSTNSRHTRRRPGAVRRCRSLSRERRKWTVSTSVQSRPHAMPRSRLCSACTTASRAALPRLVHSERLAGLDRDASLRRTAEVPEIHETLIVGGLMVGAEDGACTVVRRRALMDAGGSSGQAPRWRLMTPSPPTCSTGRGSRCTVGLTSRRKG